jgi:hypothetical protein
MLIGTSKIPLWDTVKHFGSRMNILMMFGDDIGMYKFVPNGNLTSNICLANTPQFVDCGLKYIDEVTLVSEAAKSFPAFLVP